jgi:cytochrome c5
MGTRRVIGLASVATLLVTALASVETQNAGPRPPTAPGLPGVQGAADASPDAPFQAVLDRYCATCHNDRVKAGGMILERLSADGLRRDP